MIIDIDNYKQIIKASSERDRLGIRERKRTRLEKHHLISSCGYDETTDEMTIELIKEEGGKTISFETKGIDLEGLFTVGGVLKKSNGKDNEEGYLKVEPIG